MYNQDICLQNKCINLQSSCVFTITSLKQFNIPSSPTSAAGSVKPTTQNKITQHPQSEKHQHVSVSFSSLRYSKIMLVSMWAPMNTKSQLVALARTKSDRFYRYIAIEYCIYLQCVHNLTTNSGAVRASRSWQETTEEGVHARREVNQCSEYRHWCNGVKFLSRILEINKRPTSQYKLRMSS